MRGLVLSTCVLVACVQPSLVECPDGRACPTGTACDVRHQGCVDREQATACAGLADLTACATSAIADGRCFGEICLPRGCGNAELEPEELCDDGNTLAGDGCGASCLSLERCGDGFVESPREECDDGNVLGQDGCSSRCRVETLVFERLQPSPPTFEDATSAYDPIRDRLVVFSTMTGVPTTWEWDGKHWYDLTPTTSPSARTGHAMAYDPTRRVTVLFGGTGPIAPFNDTWEWNGARWLRRLPAVAPNARTDAALAWDPRVGKVVLFGGVSVLQSFNDTWTWDGDTWARVVTSSAPDSRGGAALVFDASADRLIVAGGYRPSLTIPTLIPSTWSFDGTTWSVITGAVLPSQNNRASATFDAEHGSVVISSGTMYELVASRWVARGTASTAGRIHYRPTSGTLFELVPGALENPFTWNGAAWIPSPRAPWPPAQRGVATADPFRGHVVLFGNGGVMWRWDGRGWADVTTPGPGALSGAAIAYDERRREVILFGGALAAVAQGTTWRWDGASWSVGSDTGPSARRGHAMTYDPDRGVVLLFGGITATGVSDETWEWNGTEWTLRTPPTSPSARTGTALAYDREHHVAILFGGNLQQTTFADDTWTWDGATWVRADVVSPPLGRTDARLVYDSARRRTLMFGGSISDLTISEWNGATWSQPLLEWQVGVLNAPAAAYDPVTRHTLIFGGGVAATSVDAMHLAHFTSGDVERCDDRDLDHDALVGCADADCEGRCTPGCTTSPCDPSLPYCGDGACSAIEDGRSCPVDCSVSATCGDLRCDPLESCSADC